MLWGRMTQTLPENEHWPDIQWLGREFPRRAVVPGGCHELIIDSQVAEEERAPADAYCSSFQ